MIKIIYFTISLIVASVLSGCDIMPSSKSKILGSWKGNFIEKGTPFSDSITFYKNGTWTGKTGVTYLFIPIKVASSGKWNIKDEILTIKCNESSLGDLIPVGTSASSKIISIDQESLTLEDEGKIRRYEKVQ